MISLKLSIDTLIRQLEIYLLTVRTAILNAPKIFRIMRLKIFFIPIIFLISILSCFAKPAVSKYVGYRHKGIVYGKKLPNGVRDLGGGLLSDENYGVTRFARGLKYMLWLERITGRDAKDVPSWEVRDVLVFTKLKKNQEFLFSYSSPCTENGEENLDLIVLAQIGPKRKVHKILQAWRVNVALEKFEKISTTKIRC